MSNSINRNDTANYEPSHLDLRCLQKPIVIAWGSERVNAINETSLKSKQKPKSRTLELYSITAVMHMYV